MGVVSQHFSDKVLFFLFYFHWNLMVTLDIVEQDESLSVALSDG